MSVTKSIHEPFDHQDVASIVDAELGKGDISELKTRVTQQVRRHIGMANGALPERVGTWIHRLCLHRSGYLPLPEFKGKLASAIDLASLPNRSKRTVTY